MPLLYWALEDIQQTITPTGYIIVTQSDVACHMWLRWTEMPPQKHPKAVTTRGLTKMTDARFCFVAFCDVEQEEEGDTFTHSFLIPSDEAPADPPTYEWPFYEPWGSTLTDYNWWNKYKEPEVPNVSFENGIITIENPGYEDCGIVYNPPVDQLPIAYSKDKPLKIAFNNTEATANSTSSQIVHELIFRKDGESFTIYLCISCGAQYDSWKPWTTGTVGGRPYVWIYFGTGEYTVNLLYWFTKLMQYLGLDDNPEGWFLNTIAFALGTQSPSCTDHLKSDYVGCYLPQTSHCNMQPWITCETRYFYFWATNAGERMKSTSPIFSKHYGKPPVEHTDYFYPDPHPENTSVDGHCWRALPWPYETFEDMWRGEGTNAESDGNMLGVRMFSSEEEDLWRFIYRDILVFDTASIPEGSIIIKAKLRLQVYTRSLVPEWDAYRVGVVASYPISNIHVSPVDYQHLGTIPRSNSVKPQDVEPGTFVELTLYPSALTLITPGGHTRLGLRDYGYDAFSIEPDWLNLREIGINFYSADNEEVSRKPRLEVTYLPPPGEYEETYDTDNLTASAYTLIYNRIEFKKAASMSGVKVKTRAAGDYTLRIKSDDGDFTYYTDTILDAPADSWITHRIPTFEVHAGLKYRMEITRPQAQAYAAEGLYDGYYWKNNKAGFGISEYDWTNAMGILYVIS